jgi:hypothetical protein
MTMFHVLGVLLALFLGAIVAADFIRPRVVHCGECMAVFDEKDARYRRKGFLRPSCEHDHKALPIWPFWFNFATWFLAGVALAILLPWFLLAPILAVHGFVRFRSIRSSNELTGLVSEFRDHHKGMIAGLGAGIAVMLALAPLVDFQPLFGPMISGTQ